MMKYADYEFYIETYEGALSQDLFDSIIMKASREIDKVVNRKIHESDITDRVKCVACELVDFLNEYSCDKNNGNKLVSISIDGVEKRYREIDKNELEKEKRDILNGLPHELTRFL